MNEHEIEKEVHEEFAKGYPQLAADIIREANAPLNNHDNVDLIKHLVKRVALHQLVLEGQAKWTNTLLVLLAFIGGVASVFTIMAYFAG
ncbi:MAG: hypothetical protein V3T99_03610 [Nitrososphaerales archaeon]